MEVWARRWKHLWGTSNVLSSGCWGTDVTSYYSHSYVFTPTFCLSLFQADTRKLSLHKHASTCGGCRTTDGFFLSESPAITTKILPQVEDGINLTENISILIYLLVFKESLYLNITIAICLADPFREFGLRINLFNIGDSKFSSYPRVACVSPPILAITTSQILPLVLRIFSAVDIAL